MNLVERARNILLTPQTGWAVIETEPTDPRTLYTSYIAIVVGFALAMINASSIGMGAVGIVSGIR